MKNSLKVWIFLGVLALSIVFTGHYLAGRQGVLLGVVLAAVIIYSIFGFGKSLAEKTFKSKDLLGSDPWGALEIVRKLSNKARVPLPRLKVIQWDFPTVLVAGTTRMSATIFITEGLVKNLNKAELEAVMAQQIARIKRQDILTSFVTSVLVTSLLAITNNGMKNKNPIKQSLLLFLAPVGSLFIKLSIRSQSYIEADALAGRWIEDPKNLATALLKLESFAQTGPLLVPYSMANMFIVNPLTTKGLGRYFHIQPPASKRIEKLVGNYPI